MVEWFVNLDPILQAFLATCFTWFITALGAAMVFFFKEINQRMLDALLGFAAGAMIFVVIEELIPESQLGKHADIATAGAMLGFVVMMALDVALG